MKRPRGLGLYHWRQVKNENAVTLTAGLVVASVLLFITAGLVSHQFDIRRDEIEAFGSAELHLRAWMGILLIGIIGIFYAHAGVIYWWRRILRRNRKRRGPSNLLLKNK